ncbi:AI-2E family transporter [Dyella caseinilytica]|uniref:AI-2E family transporter n=1 Tax=Dyella caseinilytica TaxID=1849581 RepID=A0ABX7GZP7_9GAMM|nr:AI-2E family transporter [Dyella caseinilytica]QRN55498.1 AI-2E family transporter [Dyella caseinilytica]GGA02202.1 ABC transporter permease [Dyella caseinilytica]
MPIDPAPPQTVANQRAMTIIATAAILALLYFGREVLVPVTLALILGLLMAPVMRGLRRIGFGHTPSVLIAVLLLTFLLGGLLTIIGSQVVHLARSLPQYEATIHAKLQVLHDDTLGRMEAVSGEAGKVIGLDDNYATLPNAQGVMTVSTAAVPAATATSNSLKAVTKVLSSIWTPLETGGIVLVVLIFVLLEYESLRDRFIRLIGGKDLRATTAAINDAGERLSRFFVSQFSVNFGVGVVIWLGLMIMGLPNALLWGACTAVLRFVPYVGVWLAAILASLLAAAVDPGWSLLLMTVGLFAAVEIIVSQMVEPHLYGHTTGLSPLAVVVAAIFWSWLWGAAGLILSTPLTLCLVVAGRHVKALSLLEILLGDRPALSLPERFYQRMLSGDSQEVIAAAREFLKRKSFAKYCDVVLLPALQLAYIDVVRGAIGPEQRLKARRSIVRVIETLGGEPHGRFSWWRSHSVLGDGSLAMSLRQQRENVSGRWQGPLAVAPKSIVLCVEACTQDDDMVTEILVRVLRDLNIDGRHFSMDDIKAFESEAHPEATPDAVSMVYVVSSAAGKEEEQINATANDMRHRLPEATIVAVMLPQLLEAPEQITVGGSIDRVANSFEEAAQFAIATVPVLSSTKVETKGDKSAA